MAKRMGRVSALLERTALLVLALLVDEVLFPNLQKLRHVYFNSLMYRSRIFLRL